LRTLRPAPPPRSTSYHPTDACRSSGQQQPSTYAGVTSSAGSSTSTKPPREVAATKGARFSLSSLRSTRRVLHLLGGRAVAFTELPPADDDLYLNLLCLDRQKCLLLAHAGTLFSVFRAGTETDLRPIGPYVVKAVETELRSESLIDPERRTHQSGARVCEPWPGKRGAAFVTPARRSHREHAEGLKRSVSAARVHDSGWCAWFRTC
jgi:hypothetical protein